MTNLMTALLLVMQTPLMQSITMATKTTEGDGKKKLILMCVMLVVFVIVFIFASKKMKKK